MDMLAPFTFLTEEFSIKVYYSKISFKYRFPRNVALMLDIFETKVLQTFS